MALLFFVAELFCISAQKELHGCLTVASVRALTQRDANYMILRGSGSAAHPGTKCVINNRSDDWMLPGCYRNNNEANAARCDRMIAVDYFSFAWPAN